MSPQIDNHTLSLILSERTQELDLDSFSTSDWDLFLRQVQAEGVGPLVYWSLSRSGKLSSLPKQVQHFLRAMYFSLRMNNEQILQEVETLSHQFVQAGIPVIALKGICFALTVYPDIGLRPMVDLDLLVPAAKASTAVRIAKSFGYVDAVPEALPGLSGLLDHAVCLKKMTRPFTTLEIHHRLVAEKSFTYAVPMDWFWSQTELMEPVSAERKIKHLHMLTPTAQVLYASAHAMLQHGGRNTSLRWHYDLDRLMRVYSERIDWDLLVRQAQVFEWGSAAFAALSQTVNLFETPVPQRVLDELSEHTDRNMTRVATLQDQPATHTLEEYQKLKSLNGYGRLKLILALVVPSPAYMRWRYGVRSSWALPTFYLSRWWGILKDMVKTAALWVQNALVRGRDVRIKLDRSPDAS
jgi:hypothetical protein